MHAHKMPKVHKRRQLISVSARMTGCTEMYSEMMQGTVTDECQAMTLEIMDAPLVDSKTVNKLTAAQSAMTSSQNFRRPIKIPSSGIRVWSHNVF